MVEKQRFEKAVVVNVTVGEVVPGNIETPIHMNAQTKCHYRETEGKCTQEKVITM